MERTTLPRGPARGDAGQAGEDAQQTLVAPPRASGGSRAGARDGSRGCCRAPSALLQAACSQFLAEGERLPPAPRTPPAPRPLRLLTRALPYRFTSSSVMDRLPPRQPPAILFNWTLTAPPACPVLGCLTLPVTMCDHPVSPGCAGHRQVPVPRLVSSPAPRRCRTVATATPSPSGPTTSWMAVIGSAGVMGRCDSFSAPGLPLPTGVPALRATTVATSCPPAMPLPKTASGPSRLCAVDMGKDRVYAPRLLEHCLNIL
jgi:hypothetical protein